MPKKKKKENPVHKPLDECYTEEQRRDEISERKRKEHQDIEMEIFEHLKEHTKKILRKQNH